MVKPARARTPARAPPEIWTEMPALLLDVGFAAGEEVALAEPLCEPDAAGDAA